MFNYRTLIILAVLCFSGSLFATHNRAGEITYKRIEPYSSVVNGVVVPEYRYLIIVTKYTAHGPGIADRCVDTVYFGDGERGIAPRVNGIPTSSSSVCGCGSMNGQAIGCGELILDDSGYVVWLNTYTITHVYAGPGNYLIRSFDPNRNQGVHNIPNSVNLPFYIESLLEINAFTGANSSPVFPFAPIDRACVDKCFQHNPGAYDPDPGDSLSYELSVPRGVGGNMIPGYFLPEIQPGGTFSINPVTGLLTWCVPQMQEEYNIAFIVKEWRKSTSGKYQMIGYVLRDMQVIVRACPNNDPPVVAVPPDTCVEAGALVEKDIRVSDPNLGNSVTLEGGGGPFSGPTPRATLQNTFGTITGTTPFYTAKFKWQTSCDHIKKLGYIATFKALDDGTPIKLPSFTSYQVRVVPPAVKNVTAVPSGSSIKVSWSTPTCLPAGNPLKGFRIYRKNDCTQLQYSPCQTGVPPNNGYTLIQQTASLTTSYNDDNGGNGLVVGQNYSYLVIAFYSDGSESFTGIPVCAKLKRDVPVVLNVDVDSTSATAGKVNVRWTRPLKTTGNFDSLAFPGPYKFVLSHLTAAGSETVFISDKPQIYLLDTFFVHSGINTVDEQHEYQIEFFSSLGSAGFSQKATSVFVKLAPNDRHIDLSWSSRTPWNNYKYSVYRKGPAETAYSLIGATSSTVYTDTNNVVNRYDYCYQVVSEGKYSDTTIFKPLVNRSQRVCTTAVDKTPPCPPVLSINGDCPAGFVEVSWSNVRTQRCGDDVVSYILNYKPTLEDSYTAVYSGSSRIYTYDGTLVSGCYAVQSVDSAGNKSELSRELCLDNCPEFELPNLFTPNGDGVNDVYKAIKVRQVKEIDLRIVDRWGNVVYTTNDPYFQWDGRSVITKIAVADGTFFYVCDVFEPRLSGIVKRTIKGYVEVAR